MVVDTEALLATVHLYGFLKARIEPACANASVTIANAMPVTRSDTALSTAATTSPTTAVNPTDSQKPQCQRVIAIAVM